ncbi:bifunctional adenosylcobinamide kinase/adenosylcobinamide-phosphate guanylyltransferase [Clostridium sp. DL1XJH146]
MSKITLVTGGCRSGKSSFAENIYKDEEDVLYIATAKAIDDEMKDRIDKHKKSRNNKWSTYEGYRDLDRIIEKRSERNILLDCVTILITNYMFEENRDIEKENEKEVDKVIQEIKIDIGEFILKAREENKNLVFVTNEVGYGIVPEYKLGRIFRDITGFINKYIADQSDEVYLTVCGIPMKVK